MNNSHDASKSLTGLDQHGGDSHSNGLFSALPREAHNADDFSTRTTTITTITTLATATAAASCSSHRFATISGAEALQNEIRRSRGITTGLASLDAALVPAGSSSRNRSRSLSSPSGIRQGHVTEIYGPPGVGKTTFGMQLASHVLCGDGAEGGEAVVVWLSTGSPLFRRRLADIVSCVLPYDGDGDDDDDDDDLSNSNNAQARINRHLARFHYREVASLPHILTLVLHPTPLFPPPNTRLLIIDDLSNLILSSLPWTPARDNKVVDNAATTATLKRDPARRIQTIEALSSGLSSLAASRQLAAVVLNKCTTTHQPGTRAVLRPALAGQAWDSGIYARIVLYRDSPPPRARLRAELHDGEERVDVRRECRLAEVVRLGHQDVATAAAASGGMSGGAVPFVIDRDGGMREVKVEVQIDAAMGSSGHEEAGREGREEAINNADQNAWAVSPPPSDPLQLFPVLHVDRDGDGHDNDGVHHLENGGPASATVQPPPLLLNPADSPLRHQQVQQHHHHHPHKRKITEIADSDDDDDDDDGGGGDKEEAQDAEEVPLPPPPPSSAGPVSSSTV